MQGSHGFPDPFPREDHEFPVLHQIAKPEGWQATLFAPRQFPRAAQLQIHFRDLKAIMGSRQCLKPFMGAVRGAF